MIFTDGFFLMNAVLSSWATGVTVLEPPSVSVPDRAIAELGRARAPASASTGTTIRRFLNERNM